MNKSSLILLLFSIISCNEANNEFIVGKWTNDGRYVIENGERIDEFYAADYLVTYEFFSDNTYRTSLDVKGKWNMKNDSILNIDMDSLQQKFFVKIDSDTSFILKQKKNKIDYIYKFIKKE